MVAIARCAARLHLWQCLGLRIDRDQLVVHGLLRGGVHHCDAFLASAIEIQVHHHADAGQVHWAIYHEPFAAFQSRFFTGKSHEEDIGLRWILLEVVSQAEQHAYAAGIVIRTGEQGLPHHAQVVVVRSYQQPILAAAFCLRYAEHIPRIVAWNEAVVHMDGSGKS